MELKELLNRARSLADIDTNAAIYRCRQFAETVIKALADETGVDINGRPLVDQINTVAANSGLQSRTVRALHNLRVLGNKAVHHHLSGGEEAQSALALCEEILAGTKELLSPGAGAALLCDSPVEADETEGDGDPGPLLDAIRFIRDQAQFHMSVGFDALAVECFECVDRDILMKLSTSGVPREVLEQEGLISCAAPGEPLDLKKIGSLGDLGFRLSGLHGSTVKLIVPPTSRPAADLGLSPLGDAYVDALCGAVYLEGRLSRRDILTHLCAALATARDAWAAHPGWPDSIPYADLRSATLASFQWPDSQRQFFAGPRYVTATEWKSVSDRAGWINGKLAAKIGSR